MKPINPAQVTNLNRTACELQQFLIFCVLVAGKNSTIQAKKLDEFLRGVSIPFTFMLGLQKEGALRTHMEKCKLGQYNRLLKTFEKVLDAYQENPYFLRTISVEELEEMVGLKTARFFLVHSRVNVQAAILDTHVLSWLREQGYDAPKATPSSKTQYRKWENVYLTEANKRDMSLADLDLTIWKSRRKMVEVN